MSGGWVTVEKWPESSLVVLDFRINAAIAKMAGAVGLEFLSAQAVYKEKAEAYNIICGRVVWDLSYIPPREAKSVGVLPPQPMRAELTED